MENYSLLMGDSIVDEDGGGVDGGAFRSTSPSRRRAGRDSCPPDLGFAMAAALEGEIEELEARVTSLKKDLVKGHEGKQSPNDKSGLGFNSNNKNKSTTHKRKKGQGHVKDSAKIVCFKCKIEGHHVRSCPLKKKPHGEKKQGKRPQDGAHGLPQGQAQGLPRLEERPLPKKDQAKAPVVEKSSEKKEKRRTCYICREKGHISSFCTSGNSSNPILIDGAYSLCKDKAGIGPGSTGPGLLPQQPFSSDLARSWPPPSTRLGLAFYPAWAAPHSRPSCGRRTAWPSQQLPLAPGRHEQALDEHVSCCSLPALARVPRGVDPRLLPPTRCCRAAALPRCCTALPHTLSHALHASLSLPVTRCSGGDGGDDDDDDDDDDGDGDDVQLDDDDDGDFPLREEFPRRIPARRRALSLGVLRPAGGCISSYPLELRFWAKKYAKERRRRGWAPSPQGGAARAGPALAYEGGPWRPSSAPPSSLSYGK
ncbi:hypothetical protein QYE76_068525 [Lolium multiflorum]|uniref:CCHC-type domain-containing protein n=1 Tax=Lolium multiflorum TaxID=4521 RepID=A0AAD8WCP6_LOLMU|nr:hypothetical protein QYE76_068525 [Lolium multiflorum]